MEAYEAAGEVDMMEEEVEIEGKMVAAKKGKTRLLSELAQMATSGWGAGTTLLHTLQCSKVTEASVAQIAKAQKEFPLLEKFDNSNHIKTAALGLCGTQTEGPERTQWMVK